MRPVTAITLLWLIWAGIWAVAALWSDPAQKRAGFRAEARYRGLWLAGAVLLFIPAHGYEGRLRLWMPDLSEAWICVALIAIGIAFAWWARLHLGRLWSGAITAKAGHRVINTGPYGVVRHPIYTGLLPGDPRHHGGQGHPLGHSRNRPAHHRHRDQGKTGRKLPTRRVGQCPFAPA
ncbi:MULTISPECIES: isoprenylcysteine carboxylmethyltransferase family protein [unclassified Mesorhizobium]|uniref:methyltransferase family protein n=1 Tax=unclassified Mesorhizobium TaxID=325217 RepID=UPI003335F885